MPPSADDELIKSLKRVSLKDISEDKLKATSVDFQAFIDAAKSASEDLIASKQLSPGTIIAHKYEVLGLISSGGMGSIYKALHRQLGKQVAIKVLLVDKLVKDVTYKRFEREAKTAGGLNHPNIVSVYDYGIIGNDRPYIVMELLEGTNLDDLLLEHGYLAPDVVLEILRQTCDALAHAHARGLVHRDLKPSNIMLVNDDKDRQYVKIIDFGIAKFSNKKPETKPITKPGQIFGSPLYMSPEQCIGQELDARSDIYSLGCVIYEMLCGDPPFIGDTLLSTIYKHVNDAPPPFKEHITHRTVPVELETIVLKMMAKEPQDRFQTADEILVALGKVHAAKERTIKILNARESVVNKLWLRHPWLKTIGAIAVPIMLAIGIKMAMDMNSVQKHENKHTVHHVSFKTKNLFLGRPDQPFSTYQFISGVLNQFYSKAL